MILEDTTSRLLDGNKESSSPGAIERVNVDVGSAFPFSQEVGPASDIPDAFIGDQHHHSRHHHSNHTLSAGVPHELLHAHGYTVESHGYVPHMYDVAGGLLSEADLEGHVFQHLAEDAMVLPSTSHMTREREVVEAKRCKYSAQNGENEMSKQHDEYELAAEHGSCDLVENNNNTYSTNAVKERGGYTWWWRPGLIEPILDAVRTQQSYFKAVNYLKESEYNRDGRYDKLAPSTVESWFVRGSFVTLKNQYLHHRHSLEPATRPGQKSILSKYPELLSAIKDMVRAEIHNSITMASYSFDMKFVQQEMKQLICQYGKQEILKQHGGKLTLSPKFVRRFVKKHFANMPDPFPKRKKPAGSTGHGCTIMDSEQPFRTPPNLDVLDELPVELGQLLTHE